MRTKRTSYLPVVSVIGIIILAAAVGLVSFRDIVRGRQQVADVLEREAVAIVRFLYADIRAELAAPSWQRGRFDLLFENIGTREQVDYIALLDPEGKILVHSVPARVGQEWPSNLWPDVGLDERRFAGEFVTVDGRRVFQFSAVLDLGAAELPTRAPARRMGRHMAPPVRDVQTIGARLSDLLGHEVDPEGPVPVIAVVGLDSSELESAFLASRNHTIMLAVVLLVVGGTGIYFLFVSANYRSARAALADMRSYTTNVIESMASGLISVDAAGRVVRVNSRARDLLGLGDADVEGRSLAEVFPVVPDLDGAGIGPVLRGARDVHEAETAIAAPGGRLPVALSVSSLRDDEGRRSGAVILFQDLREMEALKEEVERARHLASLGRLAAGVAHEVRNPLSSLKGFAQVLRSRFRPGSDEERYSDIMIDEVERLDRVVQELLDFAKPVTPNRRPVSVRSLVDDSLALVTEDASYRNVSIDRRVPEDLPDVLVDPFQLRQALLNILLNAIEAMPGGGRLTVEATEERESDGGAHVVVAVSDTGPGMGPEEVGKLFEPFYTTKQHGTGLGLTIVSRIIEQNGARIGVTSARGEGTTFSVRLPIATGARGGSPASGDDPAGPGDERGPGEEGT